MQSAAVRAFKPCQVPAIEWPVKRPYLAALKDLGLSDGQVACYFRVEPAEVTTLRTSYGIAEAQRPIRPEPPKRRLFARRRRA